MRSEARVGVPGPRAARAPFDIGNGKTVPADSPHVLFASDGACAVEQALKIAFQYWINRGINGRTTYLGFGSGYHGDTVGSMSLGGDGFGSDLFAPLRFPVLRTPSFANPNSLSTAARMVRENADELAAVVAEPLVQGAAGMLIAKTESFQELAQACDESHVLLICDEVATGFGRTGRLFASEECQLRPDILCLGKGITGGYLPMSATVVARRVYEAFLGPDLSAKTFYHGHSYGGNALAAAVALKHLELIQRPEVLANVRSRSEQLRAALIECVGPYSIVEDIRVAGLMCAVELDTRRNALLARRVCGAMVRRGVLSRSMGRVVTIVPPLTITADEIDQIVAALEGALEEVAR